MFSQEPSPINTHRHTTNHFLDDSVLFSQHLNSGTHFQLQTPFTIKDHAERDQHTQDDVSRFFNRQENKKFHQKQQVHQSIPFNIEEKPKPEKLKAIIQYANYTLQSYGFSKIGNLLSTKEEEIQKTLNAILEMISQRQRDIEYRKEVFDKIAKLESDNKMQLDHIERNKQDNSQLLKEIGNLKNLMIMTEKKFKAEKEKLLNEKEELNKQLAKFTQKTVQYQHEIRKKEVEVNKMKEQVRKAILEKVVPKSTIAEFSSSDYEGEFRHKSFNAYENDFTPMVTNNIDHYRAKLLNENQDLKASLQILFRDFVSMIANKKDEYISYKVSESNTQDYVGVRAFLEKQFEGIHFLNLRTGLLELPFDRSASEIQKIFRQNLQSLDLFFEKIIKLSVGNHFIKDIAQEFCEIDCEFAEIKNAIELRKAIQGFKSKANKTEESNFDKENDFYKANHANQVDPENWSHKITVSSPISKKETHTDNFKFDTHGTNFFMTPQQTDSFIEDSEKFAKKKPVVIESPPENHIKKARAEVNKWKVALHSKSQSVALPSENLQVQDDKLE